MLLYIDGTVRNESRTRELADYLAGKISDNVEYLRLCEKNILPMDTQTLSVREKLCNKKDFENPYFVYAKQFVKADTIILAAPYWDLSFPSIVRHIWKIYVLLVLPFLIQARVFLSVIVKQENCIMLQPPAEKL